MLLRVSLIVLAISRDWSIPSPRPIDASLTSRAYGSSRLETLASLAYPSLEHWPYPLPVRTP
jgi:hypothetical protein